MRILAALSLIVLAACVPKPRPRVTYAYPPPLAYGDPAQQHYQAGWPLSSNISESGGPYRTDAYLPLKVDEEGRTLVLLKGIEEHWEAIPESGWNGWPAALIMDAYSWESGTTHVDPVSNLYLYVWRDPEGDAHAISGPR